MPGIVGFRRDHRFLGEAPEYAIGTIETDGPAFKIREKVVPFL